MAKIGPKEQQIADMRKAAAKRAAAQRKGSPVVRVSDIPTSGLVKLMDDAVARSLVERLERQRARKREQMRRYRKRKREGQPT